MLIEPVGSPGRNPPVRQSGQLMMIWKKGGGSTFNSPENRPNMEKASQWHSIWPAGSQSNMTEAEDQGESAERGTPLTQKLSQMLYMDSR